MRSTEYRSSYLWVTLTVTITVSAICQLISVNVQSSYSLPAVAEICRKIWWEGSQGQSGQAIKPFEITPYVNDFQTLNNPGS